MSSEQIYSKLVNTFKAEMRKLTKTNKFLIGEVLSVHPLQIKVGPEEDDILESEFLYIGQMCRQSEDGVDILAIGDDVVLLGFNNSQKYYVAEKAVEEA